MVSIYRRICEKVRKEMNIKKAEFIISNTELAKMPASDLPEYGFVGRSNVGKSSLINMLCGRKNLAHTSGTPGKTQTINHYLINEEWYLADLPGYGYARTSKKQRSEFTRMIQNYVEYRSNLMNLFVLVDSRHNPQTSDLEFMEYLGIKQIPFVIVFTKIDKLKEKALQKQIEQYELTLLQSWEELPEFIFTSSIKSLGKEEVLNWISETNPLFYQR